PNTPLNEYWSSSPNTSGSYNAWFVYFSSVHVSYGLKSGNFHVRLVRAGQ
ncbi:Lcl C-terminal domain-containing protein, partial [Vibrio cholerae]|nr:DUF1566 domain-containing protein [Vibrio cholerae]